MNCLTSKKATRQSKAASKIPCNICQHDVICPVMIPCKHLFCFSCLTEWLRSHNDCPAGCSGKVSARDLKAVGPAATNLIQHRGETAAKPEEESKKKVSAVKTGTVAEILDNIIGCQLMIIDFLQSRVPAYEKTLESKPAGGKNVKAQKLQGEAFLEELAQVKLVFEKINMSDAVEKLIAETLGRKASAAPKLDCNQSTCTLSNETAAGEKTDTQEPENASPNSSNATGKLTKKVQSKIENLQKSTDPPFFKKKMDLFNSIEPSTCSGRTQGGTSENLSGLFLKTACVQKPAPGEKPGVNKSWNQDTLKGKEKLSNLKNLQLLSVEDISFRMQAETLPNESSNRPKSVLDSLEKARTIFHENRNPKPEDDKSFSKGQSALSLGDKKVSFFSKKAKDTPLQHRSKTPLSVAKKYIEAAQTKERSDCKGYWSLNEKVDDDKMEDPEEEPSEKFMKKAMDTEQSSLTTKNESDSMRRYKSATDSVLFRGNSDFSIAGFGKSSCAFEVTPEQEKQIVKKLMNPGSAGKYQSGNQGKVNQVKFIINAKWWRAWAEYVLFEWNGEEEPEFVFPRKRPGMITNRDLIKPESVNNMKRSTVLELKDNILEHHDYEAVSKFVFKYLKKWYGVDFEIIRFLKNDPFSPNQLFLDLYPEKTILHKQKQLSRSLTPLKSRLAGQKGTEEGGRLHNTMNLTSYTQYDTISDLRIHTPTAVDSFSLLGKPPITNSSDKAIKKYKTQSDNCSIQ